jgi:hypothetical protein
LLDQDSGSSAGWLPSISIQQGILASDNVANPNFYGYTKILIKNCDGSGHMGGRANPISFKGRSLYFRGAENTLAVFNIL